MSAEKFGRYKAEAAEGIEKRERLDYVALRDKVKSEKRSRDLRENKRRDRNEKVFARPSGFRENAETAISCRGPGPGREKKEICQ